jgi:hypothetical protein
MCRTATAQDPVAAHALNMGILLLLLPALTLFSGVFLFAFHFRNPADKDESEESHRRP